jgi:polyphosphate kinase
MNAGPDPSSFAVAAKNGPNIAAPSARRLRRNSEQSWSLSRSKADARSEFDGNRDDMFKATDTPWAPWYVVHSNDKKRARLNVISHLLKHLPYEVLPRDKVKLPDRQKAHGYKEPDYPYKLVPELTWPSE